MASLSARVAGARALCGGRGPAGGLFPARGSVASRAKTRQAEACPTFRRAGGGSAGDLDRPGPDLARLPRFLAVPQRHYGHRTELAARAFEVEPVLHHGAGAGKRDSGSGSRRAFLARLVDALGDPAGLRKRARGPVHGPFVLGSRVAVRHRARPVLGSRADCGRVLQLVARAHTQPGGLHVGARRHQCVAGRVCAGFRSMAVLAIKTVAGGWWLVDSGRANLNGSHPSIRRSFRMARRFGLRLAMACLALISLSKAGVSQTKVTTVGPRRAGLGCAESKKATAAMEVS